MNEKESRVRKTISIPMSLYVRVRKMASKNSASFSGTITRVLSEYLYDNEKNEKM